MFGIVHMYFFRLSFLQNTINFIITFLGGILLNILYEKSKNIVVPILVHNAFDTVYYSGIYAILGVHFLK
jgi:membrane protease YdiL (CAAX protease family)